MSTENLPASRAAQRQADLQDLLAILIAVGLIAVIHQNGTGTPRLLLALAFTCYVPGRAVVSNWPGFARWSAAAMPVAISIAVLAIVASASLWAHYWHPFGIFQVEAAASVVLLITGLIRRQVRHREGRDDPESAGPHLTGGRSDHDRYLDDEYEDVLDDAAEADWRPRREQTATRQRSGPRDGLAPRPEERWPEERWPEERWPGEDGHRGEDRRRSGESRSSEWRSAEWRSADGRPAAGPSLDEGRRPGVRRRTTDDRLAADPQRSDDQPAPTRAARQTRRRPLPDDQAAPSPSRTGGQPSQPRSDADPTPDRTGRHTRLPCQSDDDPRPASYAYERGPSRTDRRARPPREADDEPGASPAIEPPPRRGRPRRQPADQPGADRPWSSDQPSPADRPDRRTRHPRQAGDDPRRPRPEDQADLRRADRSFRPLSQVGDEPGPGRSNRARPDDQPGPARTTRRTSKPRQPDEEQRPIENRWASANPLVTDDP